MVFYTSNIIIKVIIEWKPQYESGKDIYLSL